MSSACFILLSLVLCCTQARAGAWVQPHKGYYLKLSAGYLSTTREFNYQGKRLDILAEHPAFEDASFRDLDLTAYLEYGLTARLTLIATLPFKALRSARTARIGGGLVKAREQVHTTGAADLTLSLRHALLVSPVALSLQGGLKLPLGYENTPANKGPPLGTSEPDAEAWMLAGRSLHPWPLYVSAGLGYRRRRGPLHDEFLYAAEVGCTAGRLLFKLALDGRQNTATPPDIFGRTVVTPLPGGGGALPDLVVGDQHIAQLSPALIYTLKPGLALQGEIRHAIAGKNTLSGTAFTLALVLARP